MGFAEAGAKSIVFADLNKGGAEAAAEESKKLAKHSEYAALALEVNTVDAASVQAMVDMTVKEFHRIDYFVNSAGVRMRSRCDLDRCSMATAWTSIYG